MNMKIKFMIVASSLILTSNAFAKDISVPFIHQTVPQEGLNIRYSLEGKDPQKIVCMFDNFEKGILKYLENNMENVALPFSMNQEVYFTNKDQTWERTQGLDNLEQFHVDARGYFIVKNDSKKQTAYATCFYLPETSN